MHFTRNFSLDSLWKFQEVDTIVIPIIQMRRLRLKEAEKLGQSQLVMEVEFWGQICLLLCCVNNQQHTWFSEMDPYLDKDRKR